MPSCRPWTTGRRPASSRRSWACRNRHLRAAGNFAPVRVNEQLTLDFMTIKEPAGLHLAFDVDPGTVGQIWGRLRAAGVPFGNHPAHPDNGRVDHPLRPRGLFFAGESRNLYEVMSPA